LNLIHEGETKRVYADPESEDRVIIEFTDNVRPEEKKRKETLAGKGQISCDMSYLLFGFLEGKGIDTHLVKSLKGPKLLCQKAEIIPIDLVCRNVAAGVFCSSYDVEEGQQFDSPLIEMFLRKPDHSDSLITPEVAVALGHVDSQVMGLMASVARSANHYLTQLLAQVGLDLVDLMLRFGKTADGHVVLAGELSADTMRIWDSSTKPKKRDPLRTTENLVEAYRKLYDDIKRAKGELVPQEQGVVEVVVEPKKGIKNPPGEVTRRALLRLGFAEVAEVRVGKLFKVMLKGPMTSEVLKQLNIMGIKLLSNPISESHQVRLESCR
jgi:phosphoribosylaminoimidazole-succinocarboxamide synthase